MNTVKVLDELKEFIQTNVANNIKLKCPDDTNVTKYKLVNPAVCVGWLPPKGYLPSDLESTIPCIVVGMDSDTDDMKEALINIKLSLATYSPGEYKPEVEGGLTPSFNGYIDLINLADKTKSELIKNKILIEKYIIESDIRFNMYEEQPYPYWYGYMTFTIKGNSYPMANMTKYL